jgi:hypothetical protein
MLPTQKTKKCLEKLQMTEFAEDLRHRCRNPHCRMKLAMPVANQHRAFCTPGCHSSFYLKRCLVCENDKPARSTARRMLCRRPKCETRYRKNMAHYSFLGGASELSTNDTASAANAPRSAQSTGIKIDGLGDRARLIPDGPDCAWRLQARDRARLREHFRKLADQCLIQPHHSPVNIGAAPPFQTILAHDHCVGFLPSAGPRGFQAYDAAGQLLGLFQDEQAAIEAITALNSTGDTNGNL